mmetsp:Transcript_7327/g.16648  ORF Transcript_7327/g.16648 Transcript_7327/m.16648 type:complete len:185 (+) Transcript_7327:471-1025(+)
MVRRGMLVSGATPTPQTTNAPETFVRTTTRHLSSQRISGGGGMFFKKNNETGHYEAVPDRVAREKVGQLLRDALHTKYKSSSIAKQRKRVEQRKDQNAIIQQILEANNNVAAYIGKLHEEVHDATPESQAESLFNETNVMILRELKRSDCAKTLAVASAKTSPLWSLSWQSKMNMHSDDENDAI